MHVGLPHWIVPGGLHLTMFRVVCGVWCACTCRWLILDHPDLSQDTAAVGSDLALPRLAAAMRLNFKWLLAPQGTCMYSNTSSTSSAAAAAALNTQHRHRRRRQLMMTSSKPRKMDSERLRVEHASVSGWAESYEPDICAARKAALLQDKPGEAPNFIR